MMKKNSEIKLKFETEPGTEHETEPGTEPGAKTGGEPDKEPETSCSIYCYDSCCNANHNGEKSVITDYKDLINGFDCHVKDHKGRFSLTVIYFIRFVLPGILWLVFGAVRLYERKIFRGGYRRSKDRCP